MARTATTATIVVGLAMALPRIALAQNENSNAGGLSPEAAPAVTPQESSNPSYHHHDGFYLRLSLGGGYVHNWMTSDAGTSAKVYGATIPFEIMIGGTIAQGLALGLGITLSPVIKPKASFEGQSESISSAYRVQYSRLGPFIDYFPNPSGGLHVLGSLNYAGFTFVEDATDRVLGNAKGVALTAGVGYCLWISAEWSVGLLAQLSYARLWAPSEFHSVIAPALMAEFTYH